MAALVTVARSDDFMALVTRLLQRVKLTDNITNDSKLFHSPIYFFVIFDTNTVDSTECLAVFYIYIYYIVHSFVPNVYQKLYILVIPYKLCHGYVPSCSLPLFLWNFFIGVDIIVWLLVAGLLVICIQSMKIWVFMALTQQKNEANQIDCTF